MAIGSGRIKFIKSVIMLTCEKVLECKSMKEIESGEAEQVLCSELVLDIVW